MSAFVLDCSVTMSWCFNDEARPETDELLDQLGTYGATVPSLWYWEVANVLNLGARRGRISSSDVAARLNFLGALPIAADTEGPTRAWRETLLLAQTHKLTVYDAAYLELANRLGLDLATTDVALRSGARALGITVIP